MGKPDHVRRRGRSKDKKSSSPSTTTLPTSGGNNNNNRVPSFNTPLIQLGEDASTWYEYGKDLPGRNDSLASVHDKDRNRMTPDLIRHYRSMADSIYQTELRLFNQSQDKKSSSDERWVENTMRKGTLKDRIAAMSVTLSGDPLHKFYALDGLLSMVGCSSSNAGSGGKPNSRVAQLTAEALEDLFINTLLPPNRKLVTLAQRPLFRYDNNNDDAANKTNKANKTLSPRILLLWRFEEMIKEKYDAYLHQYMVQTLQDGAEQQKIATLQSAASLLSSVPEGETKLLGMMVNKLGDPDKKTAAAAAHQLRIVLQRHPNMQMVIAREVQQLAHRPHLSPKALYNCIIFLNQLQLKRPEAEAGVIDNEEENFNRQSMGTLSSLPASLIKTYFRLFEVAIQQNKKSSSQKAAATATDDAGSMKGRLLSALLTGVNRAHPYLPEKDQDMEEHVDALYRIVHTAPPAASTQALMLVFHLAVGSRIESDQQDNRDVENNNQQEGKESIKRKDRFYRALYSTLAKNDVVCRGKHLTMYYNLLYKAMKYDCDSNRVHAFAKRLLAAVMHAPPPAMAASLFLLQEISKTQTGLSSAWEDVPDPDSNASLVLDDTKREAKAGIVHLEDLDSHESKHESQEANGAPPCWEIGLFAQHFHPSVSKFASDIGEIDYAGDPLHDFGLAPFLDKFAYRNPKSRDKLLQQEHQAGRTAATSRSRRMKKLQARLELPVNDPSFLVKTNVDEQEQFFHRFFSERARRDEIKGVTRNTASNDDPSQSRQLDDGDNRWNEAEEHAFDAAEEAETNVGGKRFEEYEALWETDEEEEAFVDSLALKLLEDVAGGPADIDDDPDMEDWGDLHSEEFDDDGKEYPSDGDASNQSDEDQRNSDSEDNVKTSQKHAGDDDAFMEVADSSDCDGSSDSDEEPMIDESEIVGGLSVEGMDQNDDNEESTNDEEEDEDDDGFGMMLAEEESDDDVQEKSKKKKQSNELPTFADADEYFEMIEKSFHDLKRSAAMDFPTEFEEKQTKKKKKRRKH
jgi:ribosome biogenesis protein MAK21